MPASYEDRVRATLAAALTPDGVDRWLQTPCLTIGGRIPETMLALGRGPLILGLARRVAGVRVVEILLLAHLDEPEPDPDEGDALASCTPCPPACSPPAPA